MKITPAKIFLIVAIAVIAFAIYDYRKSATEESDKLVANRVFPSYLADDVTNFKIHSLFGDIAVERSGAGWQMTVPVKDSADKQAVEVYLNQLLNQEARKVEIETAADVEWSQYGLDKPDGWVEVSKKDTPAILVQVGTVRAVSNGHYLRKDSGPTLLVGTSDWTGLVNRPPQEFRNKSLFDFETDVTEFTLIQKSQRLQFKKVERTWKLFDPENIKFAPNDSELNDFSQVIKNFKADLVVADEKKDLKTFGLDKPFFEVSIPAGAGVHHVLFGRGQKNKIYAVTDAREAIFEVTEDKLKTLQRTLKDFEQKTEAPKEAAVTPARENPPTQKENE